MKSLNTMVLKMLQMLSLLWVQVVLLYKKQLIILLKRKEEKLVQSSLDFTDHLMFHTL